MKENNVETHNQINEDENNKYNIFKMKILKMNQI